ARASSPPSAPSASPSPRASPSSTSTKRASRDTRTSRNKRPAAELKKTGGRVHPYAASVVFTIARSAGGVEECQEVKEVLRVRRAVVVEVGVAAEERRLEVEEVLRRDGAG